MHQVSGTTRRRGHGQVKIRAGLSGHRERTSFLFGLGRSRWHFFDVRHGQGVIAGFVRSLKSRWRQERKRHGLKEGESGHALGSSWLESRGWPEAPLPAGPLQEHQEHLQHHGDPERGRRPRASMFEAGCRNGACRVDHEQESDERHLSLPTWSIYAALKFTFRTEEVVLQVYVVHNRRGKESESRTGTGIKLP